MRTTRRKTTRYLREGQRYFWVRDGPRLDIMCRAAIHNARARACRARRLQPTPFRRPDDTSRLRAFFASADLATPPPDAGRGFRDPPLWSLSTLRRGLGGPILRRSCGRFDWPHSYRPAVGRTGRRTGSDPVLYGGQSSRLRPRASKPCTGVDPIPLPVVRHHSGRSGRIQPSRGSVPATMRPKRLMLKALQEWCSTNQTVLDSVADPAFSHRGGQAGCPVGHWYRCRPLTRSQNARDQRRSQLHGRSSRFDEGDFRKSRSAPGGLANLTGGRSNDRRRRSRQLVVARRIL